MSKLHTMKLWLSMGKASAVDRSPSGVVWFLSFLTAQSGHEDAKMLAMAQPLMMSLVLSTLVTMASLP